MKKILSKKELNDVRIITEVKDSEFKDLLTETKYSAVTKNELIILDFYAKDRKIICVIKDNDGNTISVGKAECLPEDKFDVNLGMFIAEGRAKSNAYRKIVEESIDEIYGA